MRVVLLNLAHAARLATPAALLGDYHSLTGWAEGLAAAGAEVAVVQGHLGDGEMRRHGVDYRFVAGRYSPRLRSRRVPWRALWAVRRLRPDVVHVNGLLYPLPTGVLRWLLPRRCALVAQHHAERPFGGLARLAQRWGLGAVDGLFFTGREMAEPWRRAGLVRPRQLVFEVAEGSSCLRPMERGAARGATGMRGEPVCLWVANLDANKDPLTVLAGFEALLADRPRARLYMVFRHAGLAPQVGERIASSAALRGSVELLGEIPYGEIAATFASADLFLQGSHYEGSGYALVDALACGVVPVVTDIPAFRFLTGGACGALWPPGDAAALRAAVLEVLLRPLEPQRRAARAVFDERLSYPALGRQALAAYRQLTERRGQGERGVPRGRPPQLDRR